MIECVEKSKATFAKILRQRVRCKSYELCTFPSSFIYLFVLHAHVHVTVLCWCNSVQPLLLPLLFPLSHFLCYICYNLLLPLCHLLYHFLRYFPSPASSVTFLLLLPLLLLLCDFLFLPLCHLLFLPLCHLLYHFLCSFPSSAF